MADLLKAVEAQDNEKIPQLAAGDTVSVHVKIKEGDRERIQEFKGLVIRLRNSGNNSS
jgi:large subunit ribosomal protein L19